MFTRFPHPKRKRPLAALASGALLASLLAACGGGGSQDGRDPNPPPADPGGDEKAIGLFADTAWSTRSARIAVDARGGKHMAFSYDEPAIEARPTAAAYRYCAEDCEDASAWKEVRFGSRVRSVQLALTPDGQPRLLIRADSTVYVGGQDHFYAACDTDCTQPSRWTMTRIFSGKVPAYNLDNDDELPQRGFALDPQGRPRYAVYDENQQASPQHFGLYYLRCDERCDEAEQWRETRVTAATPFAMERVSQPALAFTPDGQPRIVSAQFFPIGDAPATLAYFACDDECDSTAGWARADLMPRGGGAEPSVDIAIDAAGRPRLAFYQEALLEGRGKRLIYMACEADCLDPTRWESTDLGLGAFNGQEPDLALDSQGRPRIAYADWERGGVGYASCDRDCATDDAQWQHHVVEDRNALYGAWPVAYPPHCTGGLWNTLTPTLALPADGPAQIAFDATYHARCVYDRDPSDNIPPSSEMNLIVRAARVVTVE